MIISKGKYSLVTSKGYKHDFPNVRYDSLSVCRSILIYITPGERVIYILF